MATGGGTSPDMLEETTGRERTGLRGRAVAAVVLALTLTVALWCAPAVANADHGDASSAGMQLTTAGAQGVSGKAQLVAAAAKRNIAKGKCGTCVWRINASGKLIVSPRKGGKGTLKRTKSNYYPWLAYAKKIKSAAFKGHVSAKTNASYLFYGCINMKSADLSGLDTSRVKNMSHMFFHCFSLESLDLSGLDTSRVKNMSCMFGGCFSLESLDLSGLDTSRVKNMSYMFGGCESLRSLDLSGLDTSRVETMYSMFSDCLSLRSLDLSGFDTSRVMNMDFMFSGCWSLESLDLSGLDTSRVKDMSWMFSDCRSLNTIYVDDAWKVSKKSSTRCMFFGCWSLEGGNGTRHSSVYVDDGSYACVDDPNSPGYLTRKAA